MDSKVDSPMDGKHSDGREVWLSGPLDPEVITDLRGLQEAGGSNVFAELVSMFINELPVRLAGIRAALDRRDPEALKQEAHRLKGSSQQMGAMRLSALCHEMERLGRAHELANVRLLDEAEQEGLRVREALIAAAHR
jgi:HPt (histidine-containing phosphotransfer) domain-containing protein